MWLWRDALLTLQDFSQRSKQKILLALNMTFCSTLLLPTPTLLSDNQCALKKQRLKESCLLLYPHWFFTYTLQYQDSKSGKYSILIELGPPVLKSSTRISYFYAPTDSEYKFHKTKIRNCVPIGFGLGFRLIGKPQL